MKHTFKLTAAVMLSLSLAVQGYSAETTSANDVFTSAIKAIEDVNSIYINAQMRTLPQEDFTYLDLHSDFVPIEMWSKQCGDGQLKMRINKPQRQIAYDTEMATMLTGNMYVWQGKHNRKYDRYNSGYLTRLLQVESLLKNELHLVQKKPYHTKVCIEKVADVEYIVIERFYKASISNQDYLRNCFLKYTDCTYFYYFDLQTQLLNGFDIIVHFNDEDIVAFETLEIIFNGIVEDDDLVIDIPEKPIFRTAVENFPYNEKHADMTAPEVAKAIFTACAEEDWDRFLEFFPYGRVPEHVKTYWGGLEIVSIGLPFRSEGHKGWFVPYEIKLKNGNATNHNLYLRKVKQSQHWYIDGGF